MLFSSSLLVSSDILLPLLLSSKILAPGSQSTRLAQSLLFICLMTTFTLMNHYHCHRLAPMLFFILALQSSSKSNSWGLPWTHALKNPYMTLRSPLASFVCLGSATSCIIFYYLGAGLAETVQDIFMMASQEFHHRHWPGWRCLSPNPVDRCTWHFATGLDTWIHVLVHLTGIYV